MGIALGSPLRPVGASTITYPASPGRCPGLFHSAPLGLRKTRRDPASTSLAAGHTMTVRAGTGRCLAVRHPLQERQAEEADDGGVDAGDEETRRNGARRRS